MPVMTPEELLDAARQSLRELPHKQRAEATMALERLAALVRAMTERGPNPPKVQRGKKP